MPPREIFTQATSPSSRPPSSGSPIRSNSNYFDNNAPPPFGQPPGMPGTMLLPQSQNQSQSQFSPPSQPAYQQQFQQYQQPTANPYAYGAQQPIAQVPSPTQNAPPQAFGGQQPYPLTNTLGTNPYQHQSSYPQAEGTSSPPQPQGAYAISGAPPQAPPYSTPSAANQDPNPNFPQDLKGPPAFSPPTTNTPPAPSQSPPVAQPPPPSPFPAVRDPYANQHNNPNNMAYTQQPGAGPVMVIDARNAKNLPRDAAGEREWSNGLCSCMDDCGTCCLAWFCPCMVYSQIKTRLTHLEQQGRPHPEGGEMCASDCFVHGLLTCCGFGWVLQIGSRGSIRDRYRISGNGCTDCMAAWCCTPCDLTQESMEIQLEERALTGHIPKA